MKPKLFYWELESTGDFYVVISKNTPESAGRARLLIEEDAECILQAIDMQWFYTIGHGVAQDCDGYYNNMKGYE